MELLVRLIMELRLAMVSVGRYGVHMELYGSLWGSLGSLWVAVGSIWNCMGLCGALWVSMGH